MKNVEPVPSALSVVEFKRSIHVMVDETDTEDDPLFGDYLLEAQLTVETATRRPMLARSVKFEMRASGYARWWFPVCPVIEVTSIKWQQADGTWADLPASAARLEMADDEPQLIFPTAFWASVNDGAAIAVEAIVGYAEGETPENLKRAAYLLVKDWYEAGIAVEKKEFLDVSFGCRAIMKQNKYSRPAEYGLV